MYRDQTFSAVVLAAGSGKRMGISVAKQYLPLLGKPLMVYALDVFAKSPVDEIILVAAPGETEYCRRQIVEKYGIEKVARIVEGGQERYDSVYAGLQAVTGTYVLIHDSARAFLTGEIVLRAMDAVIACGAAVVAMPVKDTIKEAGADGIVSGTPDRSRLWSVQTPQCFETKLVRNAYGKLMGQEEIHVTDDAMVVEQMTAHPVRLIEGSYENIKVTTPDDLLVGEAILRRREKEAKKV